MKRLLLAIAALFAGAPASAATTPPTFSISCGAAVEGGAIPCTIRKNAKASSYSKVTFATRDGGAIAGRDFVGRSVSITFGNNVLVQTVYVQTNQDAIINGSRVFYGTITVTRYGKASTPAAQATIRDDDVAAPPPPATKTCPDGSVILATSECPVVPPPPPAGPLAYGGKAVAVSACLSESHGKPLVVGKVYTVFGFYGYTPADMIGHDSGSGNPSGFVIVNDVFGDGYGAYWVPVDCVRPG